MSSRAGRSARAVRGAIAAAAATFAVTVTHSIAAGMLPSSWAMAVAFVAATLVCVACSGRRLSWWRLSGAVAVSQAFFHVLLAADFGGSSIGGSPALGHAHQLGEVTAPVASHAVIAGIAPAMWIAHAVAAVLTVLVIGFGERSVAALVRLARRSFRALRPVNALPSPRADVAMSPSVRRAPQSPVLSVVRRRGPPLSAV